MLQPLDSYGAKEAKTDISFYEAVWIKIKGSQRSMLTLQTEALHYFHWRQIWEKHKYWKSRGNDKANFTRRKPLCYVKRCHFIFHHLLCQHWWIIFFHSMLFNCALRTDKSWLSSPDQFTLPLVDNITAKSSPASWWCSCRYLRRTVTLRTGELSPWRTWQQQPQLRCQWRTHMSGWDTAGQWGGWTPPGRAHMGWAIHSWLSSSLTGQRDM